MIRSMTAFASAEGTSSLGTLTVELRSVNHRYLEQGLRLPESLRSLESVIREQLNARLGRGKVDVGLRLKQDEKRFARMKINQPLLDQLAELMITLDNKFPSMHVSATELLNYPGVMQSPAIDDQALAEELKAILSEALDKLIAAREREGTKLEAVLQSRLEGMEALTKQIRMWLPDIRKGLKQRMENRLADLGQPLEPGRLEQELVLQLNKLDVDEELDRLDAHLVEIRHILKLDEPVGRRLDFLMQELNREANTLGSKSVDSRTTNAAVELKVFIEQMREQVQNIE